uniref:Uncharacterized protein n=1 Tax=Sus scrofa TaxID=9823 RepID=A0A8D1PWI0_PIG
KPFPLKSELKQNFYNFSAGKTGQLNVKALPLRVISESLKRPKRERRQDTSVSGSDNCLGVVTVADVPRTYILTRKVQIFIDARTQVQSLLENTKKWFLEISSTQAWEPPYATRSSLKDPTQNIRVRFTKKQTLFFFKQKSLYILHI